MKLEKILNRMIREAMMNKNKKCTRTLKHGLTIEMLYDQQGNMHLQLIRDGAAPSIQEWNTVMKELDLDSSKEPKGYLVQNLGNAAEIFELY